MCINLFGGSNIYKCRPSVHAQAALIRETYARAVETLVELASLQTAFVILDEVIKVVNRRVNAMWVSPALALNNYPG